MPQQHSSGRICAFGGDIIVVEREPFTAPGGTLFLLGPVDVLLTTFDGQEATVPWSDFAALFRHLFALEGVPLDKVEAPRIRLLQIESP